MMNYTKCLLVTLTLLGALPAPALEISEVLVENEGGLEDADFSSPGWVELFNETAAAVDTAGWHLTDDPLLPGKWTLPSRVIPAGGRLVVFASGKDRAPASGELHTNFQMDLDGEYLALTRPDLSVAQEYAPVPKLRRNVSWAYAAAAPVTTPVVTVASQLRWQVPADDSAGDMWKAPGFVDTAWSTGLAGLGFDATAAVARVDVKTGASLGSLPSPSGWQGFGFSTVPESGTGPVTASVTVGSLTVRLDAVGSGLTLAARNRQGGATDILNDTATLNNLAEDFVFASTSNYVAGTPKGMNVTVSGLTAGATYPVTLYAYDRASSTTRAARWTDAVGGATGVLTFNGSSGQLTDDAAFQTRSVTLNVQANASGQIILQGRADATGHTTSHNVFLNALSVGSASYAPLIATDVGSALQGVASSLYARAPFSLTNPEYYQSLRLRVRYDDGFSAWLNGTLIASRNAPAAGAWNATATADQPKAAGMVYEEITVPVPAGVLVAGANVLALQGLTQGGADTDFLLSPLLELQGTLPPGGVYYAQPTPGAVNATPYTGLVRDTTFTTDRQYFTTPVATGIGCPTPGAQIRYTLDGSVPAENTGTLYTTPLIFNSTAILRAVAFVPGWIPSNPDTQSYLHTPTLAAQPANPAGWPLTWGINSEVNTNDGAGDGTVPANYAMDQRVVTNTVAGYTIPDALAALPTFSIAMAPSDFLGPNGIYQNPQSVGTAWERDCSVEMLDPTGAENGFHETCRIEVHGNSSRRPYRMQKHALRLSFKGEAGAASLRYRFFPGSKLDKINKLTLRATFTDGWGLVSWDAPRYRPDDSTMTRDVWIRRSWEAMGNITAKSRYVHVVINGLYWGVYDASEHIDNEMLAENAGGLPGDYDVMDLGSDYVDVNPGTTGAWETMMASVTSLAAATLPGDIQTHYQGVLQYLDAANFADYYLLHQYAECEDWPHHNGNAWLNRTQAGAKFLWLPWDQEIALQETGTTANGGHNIDRISPAATNTTTANSPGPIWNALRKSPEWRLLVADRAHYLFMNNGPLSCPQNQARWQSIAAELDKAIVAESARWGDTAAETPYGNTESRVGVPLKDPYLRDPDWLGTINNVASTWIPSLHDRANSYAIITRLQNQSPTFWPAAEPPVYGQHGGVVAMNFPLTMSSPTPGAVVYYTLDGSDPRVAVTGAAAGTAYTGAVPLLVTGMVNARAVTGVPGSGTEVWSALTSAQFIVGTAASAGNLAISEIMYNPPDGGLWEFVELMNISAGPVDLTGVRFVAGIDYAFAPGTVLAAGARLVLAGDAAGFAGKYPSVVTAGIYTGKLDNSGEQIAIVAADGSDIRRFVYNDVSPWPAGADGEGCSLVLVAPLLNPDHALPQNWRVSTEAGGSPGGSDAVPFTGNAGADSDGDGYSDLLEYVIADPEGTVAQEQGGIFAVTWQYRAGADDAAVIVETSTDMVTWNALGAADVISVNKPVSGLYQQAWRVAPAAGERIFVRARAVLR